MRYYDKNWHEVFEDLFLKEHPLKEEEMYQVLRIGNENSFTYLCQLWEGVFLWANDIHMRYYDYPQYDLNRKKFAVINLGHAGRCEVGLVDDTYVYMAPGLLNINSCEPQTGYDYPGGFYEGLEIALDLDILAQKVPPELLSFGLSLEYLQSLLKDGGNYMAAVSEEGMQQSRFLYEALKNRRFALEDYRFYTVSLLYHLKNRDARELKKQLFVTKGQRRIAKEVEQILTEDFRRRFTVEELAGRYEISPSALKKYFESVFGMPISYYLREKRMEKAKELLLDSGKQIGEIAMLCGYENQSKFGAAFKTYAGASPLEYRRLYKASGEKG